MPGYTCTNCHEVADTYTCVTGTQAWWTFYTANPIVGASDAVYDIPVGATAESLVGGQITGGAANDPATHVRQGLLGGSPCTHGTSKAATTTAVKFNGKPALIANSGLQLHPKGVAVTVDVVAKYTQVGDFVLIAREDTQNKAGYSIRCAGGNLTGRFGAGNAWIESSSTAEANACNTANLNKYMTIRLAYTPPAGDVAGSVVLTVDGAAQPAGSGTAAVGPANRTVVLGETDKFFGFVDTVRVFSGAAPALPAASAPALDCEVEGPVPLAPFSVAGSYNTSCEPCTGDATPCATTAGVAAHLPAGDVVCNGCSRDNSGCGRGLVLDAQFADRGNSFMVNQADGTKHSFSKPSGSTLRQDEKDCSAGKAKGIQFTTTGVCGPVGLTSAELGFEPPVTVFVEAQPTATDAELASGEHAVVSTLTSNGGFEILCVGGNYTLRVAAKANASDANEADIDVNSGVACVKDTRAKVRASIAKAAPSCPANGERALGYTVSICATNYGGCVTKEVFSYQASESSNLCFARSRIGVVNTRSAFDGVIYNFELHSTAATAKAIPDDCAVEPICGNNAIDAGETCDGTAALPDANRDDACRSKGYLTGTAAVTCDAASDCVDTVTSETDVCSGGWLWAAALDNDNNDVGAGTPSRSITIRKPYVGGNTVATMPSAVELHASGVDCGNGAKTRAVRFLEPSANLDFGTSTTHALYGQDAAGAAGFAVRVVLSAASFDSTVAYAGDSSTEGWKLALDADKKVVCTLYMEDAAGAAVTEITNTNPTALTADTYTAVACAYDGDKLRAYVDGTGTEGTAKADAAHKPKFAAATEGTRACLGGAGSASCGSRSAKFLGDVDSVSFWSGATVAAADLGVKNGDCDVEVLCGDGVVGVGETCDGATANMCATDLRYPNHRGATACPADGKTERTDFAAANDQDVKQDCDYSPNNDGCVPGLNALYRLDNPTAAVATSDASGEGGSALVVTPAAGSSVNQGGCNSGRAFEFKAASCSYGSRMTVETSLNNAMLHPKGKGAWEAVVNFKEADPEAGNMHYILDTRPSAVSDSGVSIYCDADKKLNFQIGNKEVKAEAATCAAAAENTDVWQRVVGQYKDNQISIGYKVGAGDWVWSSAPVDAANVDGNGFAGSKLRIGSDRGGNNGFWGLIDTVAVWSDPTRNSTGETGFAAHDALCIDSASTDDTAVPEVVPGDAGTANCTCPEQLDLCRSQPPTEAAPLGFAYGNVACDAAAECALSTAACEMGEKVVGYFVIERREAGDDHDHDHDHDDDHEFSFTLFDTVEADRKALIIDSLRSELARVAGAALQKHHIKITPSAIDGKSNALRIDYEVGGLYMNTLEVRSAIYAALHDRSVATVVDFTPQSAQNEGQLQLNNEGSIFDRLRPFWKANGVDTINADIVPASVIDSAATCNNGYLDNKWEECTGEDTCNTYTCHDLGLGVTFNGDVQGFSCNQCSLTETCKRGVQAHYTFYRFSEATDNWEGGAVEYNSNSRSLGAVVLAAPSSTLWERENNWGDPELVQEGGRSCASTDLGQATNTSVAKFVAGDMIRISYSRALFPLMSDWSLDVSVRLDVDGAHIANGKEFDLLSAMGSSEGYKVACDATGHFLFSFQTGTSYDLGGMGGTTDGQWQIKSGAGGIKCAKDTWYNIRVWYRHADEYMGMAINGVDQGSVDTSVQEIRPGTQPLYLCDDGQCAATFDSLIIRSTPIADLPAFGADVIPDCAVEGRAGTAEPQLTRVPTATTEPIPTAGPICGDGAIYTARKNSDNAAWPEECDAGSGSTDVLACDLFGNNANIASATPVAGSTYREGKEHKVYGHVVCKDDCTLDDTPCVGGKLWSCDFDDRDGNTVGCTKFTESAVAAATLSASGNLEFRKNDVACSEGGHSKGIRFTGGVVRTNTRNFQANFPAPMTVNLRASMDNAATYQSQVALTAVSAAKKGWEVGCDADGKWYFAAGNGAGDTWHTATSATDCGNSTVDVKVQLLVKSDTEVDAVITVGSDAEARVTLPVADVHIDVNPYVNFGAGGWDADASNFKGTIYSAALFSDATGSVAGNTNAVNDCATENLCGDGKIGAGEQCDTNGVVLNACQKEGFVAGTESCTLDATQSEDCQVKSDAGCTDGRLWAISFDERSGNPAVRTAHGAMSANAGNGVGYRAPGANGCQTGNKKIRTRAFAFDGGLNSYVTLDSDTAGSSDDLFAFGAAGKRGFALYARIRNNGDSGVRTIAELGGGGLKMSIDGDALVCKVTGAKDAVMTATKTGVTAAAANKDAATDKYDYQVVACTFDGANLTQAIVDGAAASNAKTELQDGSKMTKKMGCIGAQASATGCANAEQFNGDIDSMAFFIGPAGSLAADVDCSDDGFGYSEALCGDGSIGRWETCDGNDVAYTSQAECWARDRRPTGVTCGADPLTDDCQNTAVPGECTTGENVVYRFDDDGDSALLTAGSMPERCNAVTGRGCYNSVASQDNIAVNQPGMCADSTKAYLFKAPACNPGAVASIVVSNDDDYLFSPFCDFAIEAIVQPLADDRLEPAEGRHIASAIELSGTAGAGWTMGCNKGTYQFATGSVSVDSGKACTPGQWARVVVEVTAGEVRVGVKYGLGKLEAGDYGAKVAVAVPHIAGTGGFALGVDWLGLIDTVIVWSDPTRNNGNGDDACPDSGKESVEAHCGDGNVDAALGEVCEGTGELGKTCAEYNDFSGDAAVSCNNCRADMSPCTADVVACVARSCALVSSHYYGGQTSCDDQGGEVVTACMAYETLGGSFTVTNSNFGNYAALGSAQKAAVQAAFKRSLDRGTSASTLAISGVRDNSGKLLVEFTIDRLRASEKASVQAGIEAQFWTVVPDATAVLGLWGVATADAGIEGQKIEEVVCNGGSRNPGEVCDGDDLGGATCVSEGFTSGTLACRAANSAGECTFDKSACSVDPICGDNIKNGADECDNTDFGSDAAGNANECTSVGDFASGSLSCTAECKLVTDACVAAECGNGAKEGTGEECDGTDFGSLPAGAAACRAHNIQYLDGGSVSCTAGCQVDESACNVGTRVGGVFWVDGIDYAAFEATSTEEKDAVRASFASNIAQQAGPSVQPEQVLVTFSAGSLKVDFTIQGLADAAAAEAAATSVTDNLAQVVSDSKGSLSAAGVNTNAAALSTDAAKAPVVQAAICDDGIRQIGEECDQDQFSVESCTAAMPGDAVYEGSLACSSACTIDTSGCSLPSPPPPPSSASAGATTFLGLLVLCVASVLGLLA